MRKEMENGMHRGGTRKMGRGKKGEGGRRGVEKIRLQGPSMNKFLTVITGWLPNLPELPYATQLL